MKLHWEHKESSVGRYCYIVYNDETNKAECYVWATAKGKDFVEALCRTPKMLPDVRARLSPGKEVRSDAIDDLLRRKETP
jgi:hypothetical protein